MSLRVWKFGSLRICVAGLFLISMLSGSCISERTPVEVDVAAICSVPVGELRAGGAFVPVRGFAFLIDTLRVAPGTRVTWVNCEQPPGEPHTVTSDNGVFASPFFGVGQTFSRTFAEAGKFPYHCIPHPHMRAVIIVQ